MPAVSVDGSRFRSKSEGRARKGQLFSEFKALPFSVSENISEKKGGTE